MERTLNKNDLFLITGATGFIGANLVEKLLKDGYRRIRILILNKKELDKFEFKDKVQAIEGDLTQPESLNALTEDVNVVFHLAALIDRRGIPLEDYMKVNYQGTKSLVESCRANAKNLKKFVNFSSIAAIGLQNAKRMIDETYPYKPLIPYGVSKAETEKYLLDLNQKTKFPVAIVRPPTVYGPRETYNIINFFKAIKAGKFRIIGSGENKMSFCYVGNVVNAVLLIAGTAESDGEVYFITDRRPYTMNEVYNAFAKALGVKRSGTRVPHIIGYVAGIFFEGLAFVFRFQPPLSRSRVSTMTSSYQFSVKKLLALGYNPEDDIVSGAKKTVKWYNKKGML